MDLSVAIQRHVEWKYKFRNAVHSNTALDAESISKDNNCEFGKWLLEEGRLEFAGHKSYPTCVTEHTAFHRAAGTVARAVNAKQPEQVERLMAPGSEFAESSKKVSIAIVELRSASQKA